MSLGRPDELEDGDETDDSKRPSVYLEANEDDPNVADILRELREIPNGETSSRPLNIPSDEAMGEIQSPRSPLPILLQPQTCLPLPPTITTTIPGRRRSGIRHSFSSITSPNRRDGLAEAVVELHEESASAFQDFLFWAYPKSVLSSHRTWQFTHELHVSLECKVSWTNVEKVRLPSTKSTRQCRSSLAVSIELETHRSFTAKALRPLPSHSCLWSTRDGPHAGRTTCECRAVSRIEPLRSRST